MRAMIFGASGFIGANLARKLKLAGNDVFTPARCDFDLSSGKPLSLPVGIDACFYLAQSRHYREFPRHADELFGVNAMGVVLAAKAALDAGCRFFCYASSGNVYAPSFAPLSETSLVAPASAYAASKLMGELGAASFNKHMRVMNARIFGAYGPGQKAMLPWLLAQKIKNGEVISLERGPYGSDGGLRISFIYIDDLTARLCCLAETALAGASQPPILNLAGPEAISIRDFATLAARILDKSAKFITAPNPRSGNLAADIKLLNSLCPLPFTSLESGLQTTLSQMEEIN